MQTVVYRRLFVNKVAALIKKETLTQVTLKGLFVFQIYQLYIVSFMNTLRKSFELSKSGQERVNIIHLVLVQIKSLFLAFLCCLLQKEKTALMFLSLFTSNALIL